MTRELALLAMQPNQLADTFLGMSFKMVNCSFRTILEVVTGHIDNEYIRSPRGSDGVVDSLRFLANLNQTSLTRHLMQLLCAY